MAKRKRPKSSASPNRVAGQDSGERDLDEETAGTKLPVESGSQLLPSGIAKTAIRRLGFFTSGLLFSLWLGFLAFVAWKVVNP